MCGFAQKKRGNMQIWYCDKCGRNLTRCIQWLQDQAKLEAYEEVRKEFLKHRNKFELGFVEINEIINELKGGQK